MDYAYDIHGKVIVAVDASVHSQVKDSLDFQLSGFPRSIDATDAAPYRIRIRRYAESDDQKSASFVFYKERGSLNDKFVDREKKLAIVKRANGFDIYAEYPNFLINLYIQLLLSEDGYSFVHAAAYVSRDGQATVVTGAGGIGKTAIMSAAVKEHESLYAGDDAILLGRDGDCLAFPRKFVLKEYHKDTYSQHVKSKRLGWLPRSQIKAFLVENAPMVGMTKRVLRNTSLYHPVSRFMRNENHLATVPPADIFGADKQAESADIKRVIYVDRTTESTPSVQPTSADEMTSRMFAVIHYEWKDYLTHLMSIGAFGLVNVDRYFADAGSNILASVREKELFRVEVPQATSTDQLTNLFKDNGFFN